MRVFVTCLLALGLATGPAWAGDDGKKETAGTANTTSSDKTGASDKTAGPTKTAAGESSPVIETELQQMRDLLKAQADQLEEQRAALAREEQKIQDLETRLHVTETTGTASAGSAAAGNASAGSSEVPAAEAALPAPGQEGAKKSEEGPSSIRFKGITLTPGGFVAAESVYRNHATSADINTPFNSIPYPGNALSKVAENYFTGRQSRLSLLAESKIDTVKLTGYYEADWLGTGVTSNNRQSNSYVMRQRQIFAQAKTESGWSFTGGQMWSLATENKKGIDNRGEAIPLTIDPQYNVGFTWARQYGFRVVKDFGGKFALAVAVEGPQATIGGRGFSLVTTTTVGTASVATTGNTFLDAPGAGGGLFNFIDTSGYTVNKTPDFIVKATLDPGWGHYEVFGIISTFRNRVYPCGVAGTNANDTVPPVPTTEIDCPVTGLPVVSSAGAFNDTRTGGGIGASFRVPLFTKKLELGLKAVGGDGIGRYGSAQLADLTFRPDGTEALIRTGHGLGIVEYHVTPMLDIYAYFGAEYAWRAAYQGYNSIAVTKTPAIPATADVAAIPATTTTAFKLNQIGGYGSPFANNTGCSTENPPSNQLTPSGGGTCAGDTRLIMEGTLGFWHKIYQGPKGGLRWGIQYSYFSRNGWSGNNNGAAPGSAPRAVDNVVLTSFRYYIP
ncbi:MAG: hypothetical protein WB995_01785 [Candidatus Acidiferrales bacterium]